MRLVFLVLLLNMFSKFRNCSNSWKAAYFRQARAWPSALYSTSSSSLQKSHLLQFDGGSRGNPGIGGAGAVLFSPEGEELWWGHFYLGPGVTNNQAEYRALIEGVRQTATMDLDSVRIEGDSSLVINQITGNFRVRNVNLKPLYKEAKALMDRLPTYDISHIPRERNGRADELSNLAMDKRRDEMKLVRGKSKEPDFSESESRLGKDREKSANSEKLPVHLKTSASNQISRSKSKGGVDFSVTHSKSGLVFLSGLVADEDPKTKEVPGSAADQLQNVLSKLEKLLVEVGSAKNRLIRVDIWLQEGTDLDSVHKVYDKWVDKRNVPARSCGQALVGRDSHKVEVLVTAALL
jgi:ribonuclease HI/enamine deaminase RidA (YjgF/YER057c/UK114 family)